MINKVEEMKAWTVRSGDHIPAVRRCKTCLTAVDAMI